MTAEEQARAIVANAFGVIGPEVVGIIRDEISTQYPPASDPGTPPHRRTGNLQNLIRFTVDEFHDGVNFILISDAIYSRFLKEGTERMAARDFFGDEAQGRYLPLIVQRLNEIIVSGTGAGGSGGAPPVNSALGLIYPTSEMAA